MPTTYRQYLQGLANGGDTGALALLQITGDDINTDNQGLDQTFLAKGVNVGVGGRQFNKDQLVSMQDSYVEQYKNDILNPDPIYNNTDTGFTQGALNVRSGGGSSGGGSSGGVRNAINQSFDTKLSGLRDLLKAAPKQQNRAKQKVENLYGSNFGALQSARDLGLQNISNARQEAEQNRDITLRRLGEQGRNALTAFNNQLGTFGASDSSAATMGALAIGRDQARLKSDVFNQANTNLNNINLAETQLQSDFDIQLSNLQTWRDNTLIDIADQYEALQRDIRQQMSVADADRQLALAEQSMDLANRAARAIQDVQVQYEDELGRLSNQQVQGPNVNPQTLRVQPQVSPLTVSPFQLQGNINLQRTRSPQSSPGQVALLQPQRDEEQNRLQGGLGSLLQGSAPRLQGSR